MVERPEGGDVSAEIVERIYRDLTTADLPDLLKQIATLIGVAEVAIYTAPPGSEQFQSVIGGCIEDNVHQQYVDTYQHSDIQIQRLLRAKHTNFLTGQDLTTFDELKHCCVHNDYLRPNRIDSQLVYAMRGNHGHRRTFVAMREHKAGSYQDWQIALFREIAVKIKDSLNLHDTVRKLQLDNAISSLVLKSASIGLAVLNSEYIPIYINDVFRNIVNQTKCLGVQDDGIRCNNENDKTLTRLLQNAMVGLSGSMGLAKNGAMVRLEVTPFIDSFDEYLVFSSDARILILLREERVTKKFDLVAIRYHLSISPAESRLVFHLVNGGTINSYAAQWRVSTHTARNQLKSVFNKTGIHSQKELVAKILRDLC